MLLRTKVFTRDYGNFGFFEEVIGKVTGGSKFLSVGRSTQQGTDVRKNVECSLWFETMHTLYGIDSVDDDIASLFELPHHPIDFNLWAGNSFERCGLSYRCCVGRALTLDLGGGGNDHRLDLLHSRCANPSLRKFLKRR